MQRRARRFASAWAVGFGRGPLFFRLEKGFGWVPMASAWTLFVFGVLGSVYTCAFWKLSSGRIAHLRVDVTIQTLFASMASPTRGHPQLWRFTGPCLGFRQEPPFADLLVIAEWGNPLSNRISQPFHTAGARAPSRARARVSRAGKGNTTSRTWTSSWSWINSSRGQRSAPPSPRVL